MNFDRLSILWGLRKTNSFLMACLSRGFDVDGKTETKRTRTVGEKTTASFRVLTQFALRTSVFIVLGGILDTDDCASTNWCQNSCELKQLLEMINSLASGVKVWNSEKVGVRGKTARPVI
jgi:hypothetical protein